MRAKIAVGAVAVGVALGTALLPGAASASTAPAPATATTSMTPAMATLAASSTPKTVVLNPTTGAIVSVTATSAVTPAISNHNICNSTDGCYYTNKVPYADQGFYGSAGTFHGSWPYRNAYDTGKYTAKACWTQACAQSYLGPNTYASFGGTDVTGTSFTIK